MCKFFDLESIAAELGVPASDVEVVAQIELLPEEWDDDMEAVTQSGKDVLLLHFAGGEDPVDRDQPTSGDARDPSRRD